VKPTLLILFILIGSRLTAQAICPCVDKLDTLINMVSHDYAGFHDKVYAVDRTRYTTLVDSLRKEALTATAEQACTVLRETYCAYFKDKLLRIIRTPETLSKSNTVDPKPLTTKWTADSLRKYFVSRGDDLHGLEGIWKYGTHELGLIYLDTADHYEAVIMRAPSANWKEGMVKFTLVPAGPDSVQLDYWRNDMAFVRFKAFRSGGHIALAEMGVMHRSIPATSDTLLDMAFELEHGHEVQWKILEDSTLYIKLGACQQRTKAVIDSMVKVNAADLDRLPEWIIDVRHNPGGITSVFQSLIPYLYTRTYQGPGWKYWLSAQNTEALKPNVGTKPRGANRTTNRSFTKMIRYAEDHPNTWSTSWSSTFTFDLVRPYPKRIAILTDDHTSGIAEFFLIEARGISERTIIVGENTAGMLDYCIPIVRSLGSDDDKVLIPIARMDWLGQGLSYNLTGVSPDVRVGPDEKDLVRFVKRYWGSH